MCKTLIFKVLCKVGLMGLALYFVFQEAGVFTAIVIACLMIDIEIVKVKLGLHGGVFEVISQISDITAERASVASKRIDALEENMDAMLKRGPLDGD